MLLFLLACGSTVDLTVDGLGDFGPVATSLWLETPNPGTLWLVDMTTGELSRQDGLAFDPLLLRDTATGCAEETATIEEATARAEELVQSLDDRGTVEEVCTAMDDYLAWSQYGMPTWQPANTFTAGHVDLLTGDELDGSHEDAWGWVGLRTAATEPWRAWDAESCAFLADQDWAGELDAASFTGTLDVQFGAARVSGSFEGTDEDGGSVAAGFDAPRCEMPAFTLIGFYERS